jgi:hypothetical protein
MDIKIPTSSIPKFTQIMIFGLKIYHPATLDTGRLLKANSVPELAKPNLASSFAQDENIVSITERSSFAQGALRLDFTF